jgi:F-type H+-transporting ATPase subunit b
VIQELFFASQAWASAAPGEHHGPSVHEIWFPLINFLIFAFIIVRFALPAVKGYLRSRREQVVTTLEEASARKRQAEALVNEYRSRLAALESEVAALTQSLRHDGELLRDRTVEEAKAAANKIKEDARLVADQEFNMARQKLFAEMAARAEAAARELAARHVSAADHGRLAQEFMHNIGQTR